MKRYNFKLSTCWKIPQPRVYRVRLAGGGWSVLMDREMVEAYKRVFAKGAPVKVGNVRTGAIRTW